MNSTKVILDAKKAFFSSLKLIFKLIVLHPCHEIKNKFINPSRSDDIHISNT